MNSRTYDQVTDKFMDLSIEKTNSAYMLFYERIEKPENAEQEAEPGTSEMKPGCVSPMKSLSTVSGLSQSGSSSLSPGSIANPGAINAFGLSQALEEWIWEDNMNFIQDNNIFDHTYFNFMWQMVSYIPNTLNPDAPNMLAAGIYKFLCLLYIVYFLLKSRNFNFLA